MELVATVGDREALLHLEKTDTGYQIRVDETVYDVDVIDVGNGVRSLIIDGRQFVVSVRPQDDLSQDGLSQGSLSQGSSLKSSGNYRVGHIAGSADVELMDPLARLAREAHGGGRAGSGQVKAYMPGRVVRILVEEGQEVEPGQGVLVLEAMKMENEIKAEQSGIVQKILVEEGQAVEGGDVLFEIE